MVFRYLISDLHIWERGGMKTPLLSHLLLLSVTDIEPYGCAYDKRHKHDGNDGLSVHSLVLLFLSVLKANKS